MEMNRLIKIIASSAAVLLLFSCTSVESVMTVSSPDGRLVLTVDTQTQDNSSDLSYSLAFGGIEVVGVSPISMTLADGTVLGDRDEDGEGFTVRKALRKSRTETIEAPFYRQASFTESYNELLLVCKEDYSVRFRVYDSGFA